MKWKRKATKLRMKENNERQTRDFHVLKICRFKDLARNNKNPQEESTKQWK